MDPQEIIGKFQQSSLFQKLSDNQQKFTEQVLTAFLTAKNSALANWQPEDVATILTGRFATGQDEPHNYYVATTPILTSFFKFAEAEALLDDSQAFIKVAKDTRSGMLALSSQKTDTAKKASDKKTKAVKAEVVAETPEAVGDQIDRWLDDLHKLPVVGNLTDTDRHYFDVIIDAASELMILGLKREPETWDGKLFAEAMFRRFVPILESDEKDQALFDQIPFALSELVKHLSSIKVLSNEQDLLEWIRKHHDALVHLYDQNFDDFYTNLTRAMRIAGVDTTNRAQVNAFTQFYLSQNKQEGQALYTSKIKPGQQPAFRKKGRRKKKRH